MPRHGVQGRSTPTLTTVPGDVFSQGDLQVLPGKYRIGVGGAEAERTLTIE
ncbi:hypothetical protein HUG10_15575 [Halorarum halophilum]|uniref:Uncharacterized protein n=1 Tax=Halorarum halophilum TaxID=2743090 RepID=A0A7D5GDA3_9EURY|nr:hypothetical protein [Halobaculum halophilum]QLG28872.1 hypothetical protein HUG10_15575 [Halobaculum halophilum]